MNKTLLLIAAAGVAGLSAHGAKVLHVNMEPASRDFVKESVGGSNLFLNSIFEPETPAGAVGKALRFDGYTSYIQGTVQAGKTESPALSVTLWVAPETYPVVELDTPTSQKITLAGTYDEAARKGWRLALGYDGKYAFEGFSGGWPVKVEASDLLPTYEWSKLTVVADAATKFVTLYRNGQQVGQAKCMGPIENSATKLTIGKDAANKSVDAFAINTFNGLMDDLEVYDHALDSNAIAACTPENEADLTVPESRYAAQKMRPRFHGMPATAWTNECHGMTYSNGRYHLFFQKNANGPYMTRLHWGHISSADLLDWREERIAIAPSEKYDIKGCWSGAVVTDDVLTGGSPAAIYTAVDYEKARICMATPDDADLLRWTKSASNPLINGRPAGLSDDFRDPYFFRNGDNAYIIVGSSKNGKGVCTLHRMNPATKTFSNDGSIFFIAPDAAKHGTFWEMPNVTRMPDGRWLFTVTPLGTSEGVKCLYWVGAIKADGTFRPEGEARTFELNSRDGFGLLSPTIYQHDGKTIAMGIVPDKLGGADNYALGWAHCYSLPRELSLSADGVLLQKPCSTVAGMRTDKAFSEGAKELNGTLELNGVEGRQVEVKANFTVGNTPFGVKIFRDGTITYNPATGKLTADFTGISRLDNDGWSYKGLYTMTLPEKPAAGSEMTMDIFVDGSIVDIFINDKYAQSIRLFAKDSVEENYAVFSNGPVHLNSVKAWELDARVGGAGLSDILDEPEESATGIYDLHGRLVARGGDNVTLDSGIYIRNGKKIIIR